MDGREIESVAQLAGKPLFSVGVADIGLNPEHVERNLEALFELRCKLASRVIIVSCSLLRVLEYYDGILILTTNRIRQFDIAVQSRVNLGIKYGDLEKDQKLNIIKSFLGQLSAENLESQDKIMEWIDEEEEGREQIKPLNGRQIRNILFSAASLAMKDNTPLKLDHVRKMMRATFLFHDSIKTVVEEARDRAEARRT
ncbi:hypothetical protein J3459_010690 [Metarhizium acridum]|nr:hypothetical protein J3459_010690 [Metarhizium acridum]